MTIHYCHRCASDLGRLRKPPAGPLISSAYQLKKYIKHTVSDPKYPVQSVFNTSSTGQYASFVIDSMAAGSLQVDDAGRENVIWAAGRETGFLFNHGTLIQPQDAVKVVLTSSTGEIHAFPAKSTGFATTKCTQCGSWVIS